MGLMGLLTALDVDPLVMERGNCDYAPELQELIRKLHSDTRRAKASSASALSTAPMNSAAMWESVAAEAQDMLIDLKDMRSVLTEDADKIAYFKVAAALLAKIIDLGERANNIRAVSTFQKRVLEVFDQVLTPEQRTRATEMLSQ